MIVISRMNDDNHFHNEWLSDSKCSFWLKKCQQNRLLYAMYETCISGRKGTGALEEQAKGQKCKGKTVCDKHIVITSKKMLQKNLVMISQYRIKRAMFWSKKHVLPPHRINNLA